MTPMNDRKSGFKSKGNKAYVSLSKAPNAFLCSCTSSDTKKSYKKGEESPKFQQKFHCFLIFELGNTLFLLLTRIFIPKHITG